ncbi:MAG: ABC transporter ATP-binding protein [Fimbriimonadaceae bacterium]|nr:ABC transporter ATP-binding protein [Fimbriimonadaceae bacterium]
MDAGGHVSADAIGTDKQIVKRIVALFGPHRRYVVLTILAVLVGTGLGIVPPFLYEVIIDELVGRKRLGVIGWYSGFTLLAVLLGAAFTLLYGYMSVVMGQRIMCELRDKLYTHLQSMSLKFFTNARTGDIQTRLISDVGGVQNVVSNTITDQLSNIAIVVSTVTAMMLLDWRLATLSIALVPFFAWVGKGVGEYARTVRKGTQEQTSEINSMMQETLSVSGILLSKTAGNQKILSDKFANENKILAGWMIKSSVLQYMFFGMVRLITQFAPTLVYWLAGYLIIAHGDRSLTLGKIVAFTGLQARLFFPMTGLLSAQVEIMSSFALFERIFEYLDMKRDIQDTPDAKPLVPSSIAGHVRFDRVYFKYEDDQPDWTLSDISFSAEAGQLVALVGPSGAGKTTLTYLIPRLYDPDQGSVSLDGIDLRDIKLDSLGAIVGAVTQETYLMHTSIKDNLRVAKPTATDDELVAACKAAAIHEHIAGLPEGYETIVGERGYKLSGGEKQRISIARAILKNPRILILDEATSALDTQSERLIQESLNSLMVGRTTFAIAHRLSTVLSADLILVIDKGRIVESGRHSELLTRQGLYRRLYDEQFKGESVTAG